MFYIEEIKIDQAAALLETCGLTLPCGVDYTAGVFNREGQLLATGSLNGDMIQGMAVSPDFQGEDLSARILTHLIGYARERGIRSLYLFTKAEKASQFTGLGFRLVVKARPYAALLEWGEEGVEQYMDNLSRISGGESGGTSSKEGTGALVMNCNPFTIGHRKLIEFAAEKKRRVFILCVEEDISLFAFADRLEMLKRGTADLENVTVIPGGRYVVSTLTFPSYFTKEEKIADAHAAVDAELFAKCVAPPLRVDERFLGTEPLSPVTRVYNETLKVRLPKKGIAVTEIPRFTAGSQPISASRVRGILKKIWEEKGTLSDLQFCPEAAQIGELLPDTTMKCLKNPELLNRLDLAFNRREGEDASNGKKQ